MLPRPFPFTSPPPIETKRLLMQELTSEHLSAYHQLCSQKDTMRSYGLPFHKTIEYTQKTLTILEKWFQANTAIRWGIFYKDKEKKLIGDIGFWQFDVLRNRAEAGAKISMQFQSKGLGYEALSAIIEFGFTQLKLNGVDGNVAISNKGSIALVEKLGFRKIGIRPEVSYSVLEERWLDMILFSLNQKDWKKCRE